MHCEAKSFFCCSYAYSKAGLWSWSWAFCLEPELNYKSGFGAHLKLLTGARPMAM